jgi:hypothetical protein
MHANQTLDWLGTDTNDWYIKNIREKYHLLEQYNWIDNTFTYNFNSHGFRCEEFTTEPTIMFLGCSCTCGIGLPIDVIWPELVAISLNMKCANLGQGGGAMDTTFRLCHGWIDQIKPKIIILLRPPGVRWELLEGEKINFLGVNYGNNYESYRLQYLSDESNNQLNYLKNNLAIEFLCSQRGIKFLSFHGLPFIQNDKARDLLHNGVQSHKQFAEQVCQLL